MSKSHDGHLTIRESWCCVCVAADSSQTYLELCRFESSGIFGPSPSQELEKLGSLLPPDVMRCCPSAVFNARHLPLTHSDHFNTQIASTTNRFCGSLILAGNNRSDYVCCVLPQMFWEKRCRKTADASSSKGVGGCGWNCKGETQSFVWSIDCK